MEPTPGCTYRVRFMSGNHAVYTLMEVTECCWRVVDKAGVVIFINPKTIETIRDVTGDPQYALTLGE